MDLDLTPAQADIRRQVSALARGFGWEYWREKDRKAEYPSEFVQAFAEAGWLGLVIPEAYGGAGLGVTEAVLMLEAISVSGAGPRPLDQGGFGGCADLRVVGQQAICAVTYQGGVSARTRLRLGQR